MPQRPKPAQAPPPGAPALQPEQLLLEPGLLPHWEPRLELCLPQELGLAPAHSDDRVGALLSKFCTGNEVWFRSKNAEEFVRGFFE